MNGDPGVSWGGSTISQFQTLRMSDFKIVDVGTVTRDPRFNANSFAASW